MKKLLTGLLVVVVIFVGLFGCTARVTVTPQVVQTEEQSAEPVFYVSTPEGSSKDLDCPVLFADESEFETIGIWIDNFDGSKLTYFYIDGELVEKEQETGMYEDIVLTKEAKKEGKHTVSAVQYEDNKEGGEIALRLYATYMVKPE